jgi:membrane-associated protease RseP (regulator of RpoE activity)
MPSQASLPFTALSFLAAIVLITTWHEFGHLLAAWRSRVPVKLIGIGLGPSLWGFPLSRRDASQDGAIRLEVRAFPVGMAIGVVGRRTNDGQVRRPASRDLAVAAGGPVASFMLGLLLSVLAIVVRAAPGLESWLVATALMSLFLMALNLLPLPGLDGGHMLLLAAACRGWQLSPKGEASLHHVGMRLLVGICLATTVAELGLRLLNRG